MKQTITKLFAMMAVLSLSLTQAMAANVHFKRGSPQFRDNGLTLSASGSLAGLGNQDLVIFLTATGIPTASCRNPAGHVVPGQNPATVTLSGTQAIPSSKIKNGTVSFSLTTEPPTQPTPQEAGCPGANWTATILDVQFTGATIQVFQGGQLVLEQTFTLPVLNEFEGMLEAIEG
jgi:hypothetical protein